MERHETLPEQPRSLQGEWATDPARIGVCCSGGGIRSASFNLGVLQALQASKDVWSRVRYLASVSGGGYIAGAMTMVARTQPQELVWGEGQPRPFAPQSPEERYLRNRSSYLASGLAGKLRLVANVLRGALLNMLVLAAALVLAGWALGRLATYVNTHQPRPGQPWGAAVLLAVCLAGGIVLFFAKPRLTLLAIPGAVAATALVYRSWDGWFGTPDDGLRFVRWPLVAGLAGAAVLLLLLRGTLRAGSAPQEDGELKAMRVLVRGALVTCGLFLVVPWAVEQLTDTAQGAGVVNDAVSQVYEWVGRDGAEASATTTFGRLAAILAALGVPALLAGAARAVFRGAKSWLGRAAIGLAAPALFGSVILLGAVEGATGPFRSDVRWLAAAAVVVVGAVLFADLNAGSMHRFYKRRLCTAFALERFRRDDGALGAKERDYDACVRLSEMTGDHWPDIVCCAAANICDEALTPPGRQAVTFTFDPKWVGGPEVGYLPTTEYERMLGSARSEDITLPAAIAISGAALSPSMGVQTRPQMRALLTLVNARLGVWLPSPLWVREHGWMSKMRPSFGWLVREITGRNKAAAKFLYVTDGGHWENLGLVELLRRGCTTVYCIDASGDDEKTFFTIGQAISMARSELGVEITLTPDRMRADKKDPLYCRDDHVTGEIVFPNGVRGRLVFIKAQVTRGAPWDVRAYKEKDADFPNHSLVAQMFADPTFEAYRALGHHAGSRAVRAPVSLLELPIQRDHRATSQPGRVESHSS